MRKIFLSLTVLAWALLPLLSFVQMSLVSNLISDLRLLIAVRTDADVDTLWALVQDWRLEKNLQPYTKNQKLCDIAKTRASQIKNDFSHKGLIDNGESFCREIGCQSLTENLYEVGQDTIFNPIFEKDILQGWLDSASHAATLTKNFKYSCIAADGVRVVQIFANF